MMKTYTSSNFNLRKQEVKGGTIFSFREKREDIKEVHEMVNEIEHIIERLPLKQQKKILKVFVELIQSIPIDPESNSIGNNWVVFSLGFMNEQQCYLDISITVEGNINEKVDVLDKVNLMTKNDVRKYFCSTLDGPGSYFGSTIEFLSKHQMLELKWLLINSIEYQLIEEDENLVACELSFVLDLPQVD